MNYAQSLRYLNSFVNYERFVQLPGNTEFNLKRMETLLKAMDLSHPPYPIVLIAGTVGKGSTGFFLESILREHGLETGLYHSPHLVDIRERIRINQESISSQMWAVTFSEIKKILKSKPVPKRLGQATFFEMMTLAAAQAFRQTKIDVAIFEVGLGGRLDAVNALPSDIQIMTKIDFDHEKFLGNTLKKISGEKAGIIKRGALVITQPQKKEALLVLEKRVRAKGAILKKAPAFKKPVFKTEEFQNKNAAAAHVAAREFLGEGFSASVALAALKKTARPGRLETLAWKQRKLVLDASHNPASVKGLLEHLNAEKMPKDSWLVFSALEGKDTDKMLKCLSAQFQKLIVTPIENPRSQSLGGLARMAGKYFPHVVAAENVKEGVGMLEGLCGRGEGAVICGSFYLVGEVKCYLKGNSHGKN